MFFRIMFPCLFDSRLTQPSPTPNSNPNPNPNPWLGPKPKPYTPNGSSCIFRIFTRKSLLVLTSTAKSSLASYYSSQIPRKMQRFVAKRIFLERNSLRSPQRRYCCFSRLAHKKGASLNDNEVHLPKLPLFDYSPHHTPAPPPMTSWPHARPFLILPCGSLSVVERHQIYKELVWNILFTI